MTPIRSMNEIEKIHVASKIVSACHKHIKPLVQPGITTMEINDIAEKFIRDQGGIPEQIGYMGYPYATCTSVNDEICHGFPGKYKLQSGDLVTVDTVVSVDRWFGDSAWSYAVGEVPNKVKRLMETTLKSLYIGIEQAIPGNRIGDVSHAIQVYAESKGYSVVRDFTGHGIGRVMHDGLGVPHFGKPGKGPRILPGMVFTIEPMINTGTWKCTVDPNGWTARTLDGGLSCQYEHTIAITEDGPMILTLQDDEPWNQGI